MNTHSSFCIDTEVRLVRASSQGRKASSQNQLAYASLLIRVLSPPSIAQNILSSSSSPLSDVEGEPHLFSDNLEDNEMDDSDGSDSPTNTDEPTLVDIEPGPASTPSSTIRRRRGRKMKSLLKGYYVDGSDEEHVDYGDEDEECSDYVEEEEVRIHDRDEDDEGGEGEEEEEKIPPLDDEGIRKFNIKIRPYPPSRDCSRSRSRSRSRPRNKHPSSKPLHSHSHPHTRPSYPYPPNILIRSVSYIATSILPTRYMSQDSTISAQSTNSAATTHTAQSANSILTAQSTTSRANSTAESTRSVATSVVDSITYWRELREAETDADLERTVAMLQNEWYYVGTLLLGVTGSVLFFLVSSLSLLA